MKKKILFYFDSVFLNFFIAKAMKEQIDCEVYGISIANSDNAKQFFNSQDLLKIEELSFYTDHLSNPKKEPDIEYLKKIEDKYDLNLWNIVYSDRRFYPQFNKFYKFTRQEILLILEQAIKFFESVINRVKPDFFIVTGNYALEDILLYELCKAKGIIPFVIFTSRVGYRHLVSKKYDILEDSSHFQNIKYKTFQNLQTFLSKNNMYKRVEQIEIITPATKIEKFNALMKFLFLENTFINHYSNYGKTKWKTLLKGTAVNFFIKKKLYKKFVNKNFTKNIIDSKFVFFALHFEPERSMLVGAPFYPDQLEIIRKIAKSVPIEYKVYVKEHPQMLLSGWRSKSFYKEILKIPNARLIHPTVHPNEIYKKSSLVISINGTSSLEANIYGKPSIIFCDNSFSEIPSIIQIREIEELPEKIKLVLNTTVEPEQVGSYITKLEHYSFDWDLDGMAKNLMIKFPYPGYLQHPKYPLVEMKNFYRDHKELFKIAANEFCKNIEKEIEQKI